MENILKITGNMTYTHSMLLITIICITCITAFFAIEYGIRKSIQLQKANQIGNPRPKIKISVLSYCLQFIIGVVLIFSMLYLATGAKLIFEGQKHGMYQYNISWSKMKTCIESSPKESILPDDKSELTNSIILFYRFGCEDCEAIYNKERIASKQIKDIYWVSTRSKQGKELLKKYPIKEVPAGVYIANNGSGVIEYLDSKSKDNRFDETKFETLLQLYKSTHVTD